MLNPENLATPAEAATVAVPASVPPPGFVPIATVTFPVNPVAVFPCASCAVTCTAGVIAAPAAVVLGCTENTSSVAAPAVMLNAALVALPAPVAAGVYPVPTLSMLKPGDVAAAATAARALVPAKLVAVLPRLSRAVTCTAGVIVAPADAALGCTVKTSTLAARGVTLKVALSVPVTPVIAAVSV